MLSYAFSLNSPVAIRYPRGNCDYDENREETFNGRNVRLSSGKDVDIWAVGSMLKRAEKAKELLELRGIHAGVVSVRTIKPIDMSVISSNCRNIVTIEDGTALGGFGEKLSALVPASIKVTNFGWPDKFIEHGSCDDLYKLYKLDGESIAERISDRFEGKA